MPGLEQKLAETAQEVKKGIEDLTGAFTDYKKVNDERLKQIEAKGAADPLLEEKLKKIDNDVANFQAKMDKINLAFQRQSTTGTDEVKEKATRKYLKYAGHEIARKNNLFVLNDKKQMEINQPVYQEYKEIFNTFMFKGEKLLSAEQMHKLEEFKSMVVGNDANGGYFVHPEMGEMIMEQQFETSPCRQYMGVRSISSDAIEFPTRQTLAAARWVGETQTRTETDSPLLGKIRIVAHEINADPAVTQKFLDDASIDPEQFLRDAVAEQFNLSENAAFISGDGIAKPRGILSFAAGTGFEQIEQVNSGAAATIDDMDRIIELTARLKASYRQGANFFSGRLTYATIRKLKDGMGRYLWEPSTQVGQPARLLGYDAVEAEDMPELDANSLSLAFGNFKKCYLIVDRVGMRVLRDPFTNKPFVIFDFTKRVGGDVIITEGIKLLKCAV